MKLFLKAIFQIVTFLLEGVRASMSGVHTIAVHATDIFNFAKMSIVSYHI